MQINTVGIEYRRKFNLGGYESLELSISLYAKVDADEDPDAVAEFLWHQAKASVKFKLHQCLEKLITKRRANTKLVDGL